MKMNKLRLTNVIENHFYLDFNWKEEAASASVSHEGGKRSICPEAHRAGFSPGQNGAG